MAEVDAIARAFVELADTLVDDYDTLEFLEMLTARCGDLLGVSEAGVSLVDERHGLSVLASSSERMRVVELIEVQRNDGPCMDAWRQGEPVRADRLDLMVDRWPVFVPAALDAGFLSAYAVPMRLRSQRIGALNLFADGPAALSSAEMDLAQALADVATVGILHERFLRESKALSAQLQIALTSRITVEQAKGVLAEQSALHVDDAFAAMRSYARATHQRLTDVAARVVARSLSWSDIEPSSR